MLRIGANSAHPAPAGAKLGRLRQRGVFVPLSRFDEAGGALPQTLVVVHRIFPRLTCSWFPDGGRSVQTPRQLAALLRSHGARPACASAPRPMPGGPAARP